MLRKLYCFVHAVYNPGPYPHFLTNEPPIGPKWCEFFRTLSMKASGLEEMAQEMALYLGDVRPLGSRS